MRPAIGGSNEQTHSECADPGNAGPVTFERLFDEFETPVLNYCYYRLGNWPDAEDLAQQVFTKAYAAFPRFQQQPDDTQRSMRSWIFAIAHNELVNHIRQRSRYPRSPLSDAALLADKTPGPEEAAIHSDAHQRVLALLAQLSDSQRQVVELRLAGMTDAEIGRLLDRSQGAVRATQFRAVQRLRTLLQIERPSQEQSHD